MSKKTRSAWVFGTKYKVIITKLDELFSGKIYDKEKIIYINESDKKSEQLHTAIHELMHGLFKETSLNQAISPDLEEVIVNNVATLITKNFNISWKK